jgi:hypothetical protein
MIKGGIMKSWARLIRDRAKKDRILACTLSKSELRKKFDADSHGVEKGKPFTAWSEKWVYFPITWGGAEHVERVPRHPCDKATKHIGD